MKPEHVQEMHDALAPYYGKSIHWRHKTVGVTDAVAWLKELGYEGVSSAKIDYYLRQHIDD